MSISYKDMHAAAIPHKPEGAIRERTTWVAIMLHSITSLKEIKDYNDFLWLKCHPKITLKTLKHEYFTRHPLEEFELKFNYNFPPETMQVGGMVGKHNPVPDSRVVVLRAFEEDQIEHEQEIEEDRRFVEGVRKKYSGRGETSNDAIDLDDNTSVGEDEEADTPVSTPSKKRKREGMFEPHNQQAVNSQEVDSDLEILEGKDRNEEVDSDLEILEGKDRNEEEEEEEPRPEFTLLQHWDWTGIMARVANLPQESQSKFEHSPWSYCETCGKQMLTKPWTQFGVGNGTLCTSCTMLQLADAGDEEEISRIKDFCAEELAEKHKLSLIGCPQNMDADAPLDWAHELGNIHETMQDDQDQAEPDYAASVELLDEEDAANAQLHAELEYSTTIAVEATEARLNHFERDQPASGVVTNGIQSYTTATTIQAPPTPPTSELELGDDGEMDTSDEDEIDAHMSIEHNAGARAESPILHGDMEVEAGVIDDHGESASEASFQTAKDDTEFNESAGGSGETSMREDEPDRHEVVDQWLSQADKEDSDYEYEGGDEEEE